MASRVVRSQAKISVPTVKKALLFELENTAFKGRRILCEVLKKTLADRDVQCKPLVLQRHCLNLSIKDCLSSLPGLLQKKRLSPEKLVAEAEKTLASSLADSSVKIEKGFDKMLKAARERSMELGALTSLDEKTAMGLMDRLGLLGMGARLLVYSVEGRVFPTADAWLKLAKVVRTPASLCHVIVTSSASCKAALSGGMRCVAVPDEFTSFQDFTGADYVVDDLSDIPAETLFCPTRVM